jgi:hypothetical protein
MMAEKSNMTPFKGAIYDAPKPGFPMLAVTIVNGVVEAWPVRSRSGPKDAIRRIPSTSDFVADRIRHSVLPPRVSREPPAEKTSVKLSKRVVPLR